MSAAPGGAPTVGRLTRSKEFQNLRRGKRIELRLGHIRGVATPREAGAPHLRVGFIVPKRLGSAPERNRIKRRLRAGFADARLAKALRGTHLAWIDGGGTVRGVDLGVFASRTALDMNFDILVAQLGDGVRSLTRKLRDGAP